MREVGRVDHRQALAQDAVAHLDVHPRREVVGVEAGHEAMAQQEAVGVVVDRVERDLVEELGQLALVLGAQADELLELHAGHEGERALARAEPAGRGTGKRGDRALEGDEGDGDPRRPVGELVLELVERLVELVGAEGAVEPRRARAARVAGSPGRATSPRYASRKAARTPSSHASAQGRRRSASLRVVGARLEPAREGDLRRIGERAEHPGHVLEHALLGAPLCQGPRGLALEVQDGEAIGRPQELSEVVVAVDANLHDTAGGEGVERAELVAQTGAVGDDALRALAERPAGAPGARRRARRWPGRAAPASPPPRPRRPRR